MYLSSRISRYSISRFLFDSSKYCLYLFHEPFSKESRLNSSRKHAYFFSRCALWILFPIL